MSALLVPLVALVPMHLGALHPYEKVLTFGLAFGPFLVLIVVIALRRRQDLAEAEATREETLSAPATPDRPGSPSSTP
ncbi:hypothetical protein [Nocardioides sp. Kera G14]|uniref:hypothetical protein n=1 Tax=Nocardioides sp. Kera G14 TaxID=2884264 RepID=UPI001D11C3DD|nr:hypothetical protein [Nocardioides sp. Kera G14]UDY22819.1 hypothetical protein LH076_12170 [Nocardioides sp. Kera G14]